MPQTIWKGALGFGLVNIPVRVVAATHSEDVHFHFLHGEDSGPIKQLRRCTICGEEVPYSDLVKGYEYEKGSYVVIGEEDLSAVPLSTTKVIEIVSFIPVGQVDPIYYDKSYFLAPEKNAVKPYALLGQAMEATGKVALAKVSLRQKERMAVVRPYMDAFMMETMHYPDEVREPAFPELDDTAGSDAVQAEVDMAVQLIEGLAGDFSPGEHHDRYREALLGVIDKKIAGEEIVAPQIKEEGKVVDLMAALKESVARIRADEKTG